MSWLAYPADVMNSVPQTLGVLETADQWTTWLEPRSAGSSLRGEPWRTDMQLERDIEHLLMEFHADCCFVLILSCLSLIST